MFFCVLIFSKNNSNDEKNRLYDLKLDFVIEGDVEALEKSFFTPLAFDVDPEGNIYILDYRQRKVKKFNSKGKFVKSFGGKGSGPGEFKMPNCLMIFNKNIVVSDVVSRKVNLFDQSGRFINSKSLSGNLRRFKSLSDSLFLAFNFSMIKSQKGKISLENNLSIFNDKLEEIKTLKKYNQEGKYGLINYYDYEIFTPYAIDYLNDAIYVSSNSKDIYLILKVSYTGEILKKIERKYLKRHLTKEEKENLVVMSMGKKNGNFGEKRSIDYKKAIEELYIDKYGNLLVCRESKDQFLVFDVFKEDSFVE
ncbi:MAG: hypothetical protein CSA15_04220, partial [Candidatus Delongbacteria bacterium]